MSSVLYLRSFPGSAGKVAMYRADSLDYGMPSISQSLCSAFCYVVSSSLFIKGTLKSLARFTFFVCNSFSAFVP